MLLLLKTCQAVNHHFPVQISLISLISYSIQLGWVQAQVQLQPAQMEQLLHQMMETSQPTLNKYSDNEQYNMIYFCCFIIHFKDTSSTTSLRCTLKSHCYTDFTGITVLYAFLTAFIFVYSITSMSRE